MSNRCTTRAIHKLLRALACHVWKTFKVGASGVFVQWHNQWPCRGVVPPGLVFDIIFPLDLSTLPPAGFIRVFFPNHELNMLFKTIPVNRCTTAAETVKLIEDKFLSGVENVAAYDLFEVGRNFRSHAARFSFCPGEERYSVEERKRERKKRHCWSLG